MRSDLETLIGTLIDADDAVGLEAQIAAGLSPNLIDATGESPLSRAATKRSEAVVEMLLARGAVPDAFGVWPSPLALAAEAGAAGIVEKLLAAGADVGSERWHEDVELPFEDLVAETSAVAVGGIALFEQERQLELLDRVYVQLDLRLDAKSLRMNRKRSLRAPGRPTDRPPVG